MAPCITTLVLGDSILAGEIISRWLYHGHHFFPLRRRCTLHFDLVGRYVQANIVRVIRQYASTLRHWLFYFKTFGMHNRVRWHLIRRRISLHTMPLIVIEGK
jgi:hypothetical protein